MDSYPRWVILEFINRLISYLIHGLILINLLQIKVIDPVKKTCESFLGTGKPGLSSGEENAIQFDEPGGLCVSPDGETLYVADTNNHAIRVIDLKTKKASQVRVQLKNVIQSYEI